MSEPEQGSLPRPRPKLDRAWIDRADRILAGLRARQALAAAPPSMNDKKDSDGPEIQVWQGFQFDPNAAPADLGTATGKSHYLLNLLGNPRYNQERLRELIRRRYPQFVFPP